jgi:hypothetical protein
MSSCLSFFFVVGLSSHHSNMPLFRTHTILPHHHHRVSFFALIIMATIVLFYRRLHTPITSPPHTSVTDHNLNLNILDYLQGLPEPEGRTSPPCFISWHDREVLLPQHDPDLPFPQGHEGRYIYFANQACCASFHHSFLLLLLPVNPLLDNWLPNIGIGWGNITQGMLLEAYLAYLSGRTYMFYPPPCLRLTTLSFSSYVYQNYTWDTIDGDFSSYNDNRIPARVPLTAILSDMLPCSPAKTCVLNLFRPYCWGSISAILQWPACCHGRILQESMPEPNHHQSLQNQRCTTRGICCDCSPGMA